MKFTKRITSLLLTVVMIVSMVPAMALPASATGKTADEAIAWVRSQLGKSIDADGAYGAQCVDLILAYYTFLGVNRVSGNGKDYAWNALPSGWTRTAGGKPQKGDILVYTNGEYGHVAIYESDYSHYHQRYNNQQFVVNVTSHSYNWSGSSYWGCIHPNFASDGCDHSYNSNGVCTSAFNSNGVCTKCGFWNGSCKSSTSYSGCLKTISAATAHLEGPYAGCPTTKSIAQGTTLKATKKIVNNAGNVWYQLEDGYYVWSDYVTEVADPSATDVTAFNNSRSGASGFYYVNSTSAKLYTAPSTSGTVGAPTVNGATMSTLPQYSLVYADYVGTNASGARFYHLANVTGYICDQLGGYYVEAGKLSSAPTSGTYKVAPITQSIAIRSSMSTSSGSKGSLSAGTQVTVSGISGEWASVNYNGTTGYSHIGYFYYVSGSHTHSYGSWTTVTAATCTQSGTEKRTCSSCGNAETRTVAALGHTYTNACDTSCNRCGATRSITHNYVLQNTVAATCTAAGSKSYKCSVCGATTSESIAALGHDMRATVVAPTVTSQGYTVHTCARNCGYSYTDSYVSQTGRLLSYAIDESDRPQPIVSQKITGYNCTPQSDMLVIFNKIGTVVDTDTWGPEIAVDESGRIIEYQGYANDKDLVVPKGGFVLSSQLQRVSFLDRAVTLFSEGIPVYVAYNIITNTASIFDSEAAYLAADKTVCSGSSVKVATAPAKEGYDFVGWSVNPDGTGTLYQADQNVTVTSDVTLYPVYEKATYTVTWVIDGVSTTETYAYGDTPAYKGGTPTKVSDEQYDYTFTGWSPAITAVTGNQTYTAQFKAERKQIPGDVNGDGTLSISDVTAVLLCLSSAGDRDAKYDVNEDGTVSISDVTALLLMLKGDN